jgi:hypothetical protein
MEKLMELEKRYTRKEAARKLTEWGYPIAKATLDTLATRGGGTRFSRWGRKPLYAEADLLEWVQGHLTQPVRSTAEFANRMIGR